MWLLFLVACYVSVNGGKTHSNTELELCCAQWLSRVRLFATPWTVAQQSLLSMGFSRRECWSGLPFPPPEDLLNPGTEPKSPVSPALQADSLPAELSGKPSKR